MPEYLDKNCGQAMPTRGASKGWRWQEWAMFCYAASSVVAVAKFLCQDHLLVGVVLAGAFGLYGGWLEGRLLG